MQKNSFIRAFTLALLLVCMLAGVIHLFAMRFQGGDIYPPYSSLRSDPLGTRVFYESLGTFKDITVQRNYQQLSSLKFEPHTTFLYLAARADETDLMPASLNEVFQRLTNSGGRLVLSFLPAVEKVEKGTCPAEGEDSTGDGELKSDDDESAQQPDRANKSQRTGESSPAENAPPTCDKDAGDTHFISIKEQWGLGFNFNADLPVKDEKYLALHALSLRPDLPAAISWHSNLYFELLGDSWRTVYSVNGRPVIVERPMGEGTLVLCADSFFISNEALRSDRHPRLLAWLLGHPAEIVFEETHFGVYKQTGVVDLLRNYRFTWFLAALSLLALLFVWKNTVYFVPPGRTDLSPGADVLSEKDAASGLVALLRRNFTDNTILQVCCREWEQTFGKDKRISNNAAALIENVLQSESPSSRKKPDPVAGYRKISSALKALGISSRESGH